MPPLRMDDLADDTDRWLDAGERRARLFGWSDVEVARLWLALSFELRERGVAFEQSLGVEL